MTRLLASHLHFALHLIFIAFCDLTERSGLVLQNLRLFRVASIVGRLIVLCHGLSCLFLSGFPAQGRPSITPAETAAAVAQESEDY